jgi:hypothetical protein
VHRLIGLRIDFENAYYQIGQHDLRYGQREEKGAAAAALTVQRCADMYVPLLKIARASRTL